MFGWIHIVVRSSLHVSFDFPNAVKGIQSGMNTLTRPLRALYTDASAMSCIRLYNINGYAGDIRHY